MAAELAEGIRFGGDDIVTYSHFGVPDKRHEKKSSAVRKEHITNMPKLPITAAIAQYNSAAGEAGA